MSDIGDHTYNTPNKRGILPRWTPTKKWTELGAEVINKLRKDPDWFEGVEIDRSGTKARPRLTRTQLKQNKEWEKLPHFTISGWGAHEQLDMWPVAAKDTSTDCVGVGVCNFFINRGYNCRKHQAEIDAILGVVDKKV